MTKQEFEAEALRVIQYYGKDRFEPIHFEEIFLAFERFTRDRFHSVIEIIFQTCTFPPRLAEFAKAADDLKRRAVEKTYYPLLQEPAEFDGPFVPTNEWFVNECEKLMEDFPDWDYEWLMKRMIGLRESMKRNYEFSSVGIQWKKGFEDHGARYNRYGEKKC